MGLVEHAERELRILGFNPQDPDKEMSDDTPLDIYGSMMGEAVLELIRTFAAQGHSGGSASVCRSLFSKLSDYLPLTPLTGEDDEWNAIEGTNGMYQNKRCPHVFKDETGTFDSQGKVFFDKDGYSYTNSQSHVYITFPYTPVTEYVEQDPE